MQLFTGSDFADSTVGLAGVRSGSDLTVFARLVTAAVLVRACAASRGEIRLVYVKVAAVGNRRA